MESPLPNRSFLLFPSSLHFNQNTLAVKWLKMTVHPFILVSAVLPKSLHNLPSKHTMQAVYSYTSFQPAVFCRNRPVCLPGNSSLQAIGAIRRTHGSAPTVNESAIEKVKKQFPLFTNERRLKERWRDVPSWPEAYQQDVSTANERREEETIRLIRKLYNKKISAIFKQALSLILSQETFTPMLKAYHSIFSIARNAFQRLFYAFLSIKMCFRKEFICKTNNLLFYRNRNHITMRNR